YFIKEYEDETNLRAYLLLDTSASMDYASDGVSKFDYGCTLAASLAYLVLRQQDAAGLVTFSNRIEAFIPPKSKRDYLTQILRALETRGPSGETDVGKILEEIAGQIRRRGMIILISDLLDQPEAILKGLRHFRFKGNDVIVFHIMDQAELDLPFDGNTLFEDLEDLNLRVVADPRAIRKAYRAVVEEFTGQIRKQCHDHSIDYQLISTATPLDRALTSYLSWRG
ncbi:MAG TPA: VWA domain-containing protein, partial [Candidatus Binatia bacterium]|nr:VWA domain-containing protein [Candidatus Binatia bacterium]